MKNPIMHLLVRATIPAVTSHAQSSFQNLDFELANIQPGQLPGLVSSADAIPGWTVYYGTNQVNIVHYNEVAFGSTSVDLLGTNGVPPNPSGYRSIEGEFSVLLQGGVSGSVVLFPTAASIRQTGLVPGSSRSIEFLAQRDNSGTLTVLLDGFSIPYFALSNGPNYTLYGADVSAYAGRNVDLEFSVSRFPGADYSNWNLDSIMFSNQSVPEPGAAALLLLASAICGIGVRRCTSRDHADKSYPRPPAAAS